MTHLAELDSSLKISHQEYDKHNLKWLHNFGKFVALW